jgi:hypothetical protein
MKDTRIHHSARVTGDPSSFPREVPDRAALVQYPAPAHLWATRYSAIAGRLQQDISQKGREVQTPAPVTSRPLVRSLIGRLTRVGLLAIVAATAVNVLIGYLAVAFLDISNLFLPLNGYGTIVPFTVIGVSGATVVYSLLTRYSRSPMRLFLWIAGAALALSFVPDILLLVFSVPGATPVSVGMLMLMHVAAFLVSVGMLTRLAPPS